MTRRWTFLDPSTGDTYTHQINPNKMSAPFRQNGSQILIETLAYRRRAEPREWTFGGVIRSQAQHDDLLAWSTRTGAVHVTDHIGRTFVCYLLAFQPDEKRPTAGNPWRFDYSMRALVVDYLGVL